MSRLGIKHSGGSHSVRFNSKYQTPVFGSNAVIVWEKEDTRGGWGKDRGGCFRVGDNVFKGRQSYRGRDHLQYVPTLPQLQIEFIRVGRWVMGGKRQRTSSVDGPVARSMAPKRCTNWSRRKPTEHLWILSRLERLWMCEINF